MLSSGSMLVAELVGGLYIRGPDGQAICMNHYYESSVCLTPVEYTGDFFFGPIVVFVG